MSQDNPYAPPQADIQVESTDEVQLAGRWARFGGATVDGLIGMAAVFGALYASGQWDEFMSDAQTLTETMYITAGYLLFFLLIQGYPLATRGQTLGKILLGTRIVAVADGRILPLWKVFGLRYVSVSLISLVPIVGQIFNIVNGLLIFRADRRCGHDLIAGTRVVVA